METNIDKTSSHGGCSVLKVAPDQKAISKVLASAKKKPQYQSTIIIARYGWLKRNKLELPETMDLPNLCLTIKKGKLIRAFFSDVMTHIIKKQNYYIQILN